MDKLFELMNRFIEAKGLLIKKETLVEATIVASTNKPWSHKKPEELDKVNAHQRKRTTTQSNRKYEQRKKPPFAYMKEELNNRSTIAKTIERNNLRFTMNCILYNISG